MTEIFVWTILWIVSTPATIGLVLIMSYNARISYPVGPLKSFTEFVKYKRENVTVDGLVLIILALACGPFGLVVVLVGIFPNVLTYLEGMKVSELIKLYKEGRPE